MGEATEISWTDATFNSWIGCTKVSPACDFCYAERDNNHRRWVSGWGPGSERRRTSASNWRRVRKWNEQPRILIGDQWPTRKPRVFAASLADIFDNEVPREWRMDFWDLVGETPNLQWQILTKRIGNVAKMLPADWKDGYPNVVLMISVSNQDEADRDIPRLLATPAHQRGLSMEPLLGPIDIRDYLATGKLSWAITGGESGNSNQPIRPSHPDWFRSLRDQCAAAGVPYHFKQRGCWSWLDDHNWESNSAPNLPLTWRSKPSKYLCMRRDGTLTDGLGGDGSVFFERMDKRRAGSLLDGREHKEFPA